MTNNSMTKEEWYAQQSKKQLIIFLKNDNYEMEMLRDKIALLTGCRGFGDCDGTNGGCIDCCFDNPSMFERCHLFQSAFHEYRKKKREVKEHDQM